jgi:site-specific DNA-methyltransferase (adenine-specific)
VLEYDSVNCRHGERTEHPSQKPVPLMEYLIKSFTAGIVCDPFAGSGSTLVAAKCAGRQIIGIERNEKFCELAARRCSQEMALVPPNDKLTDAGTKDYE